jgi:hypothetical protein
MQRESRSHGYVDAMKRLMMLVAVVVVLPLITESCAAAPPRSSGYFRTLGVGASLPNDCAKRVHRSAWEPRPENAKANHTKPNVTAVARSFSARPRRGYNTRWNSYLLPRVNGQFTGTTDEIIQWAACKWGIADNILRGQAVRESTWYQGLQFRDGQCYWNRGCGDAFSGRTTATTTYCNGIAAFGNDYQADPNSTAGDYPWNSPQAGMCPKTFSIMGIMAWDSPTWQSPYSAWSGNQNGTFPFSRDSTAFALDYEAAFLRGCLEGWISWLPSRGDVWGCVGAWYSGDWHSAEADAYITRVKGEITKRTWLTADFARRSYQCDPRKGCPR